MSEVLLFHHAHGLTPGFLSFAEELRAAGHIVHYPDLFTGKTFSELTEGVGFAEEIGFGTIIQRGRAVAEDLPEGIVYAGFSLGVLPAQMLAQTRTGAKGALLFHSCVPPAELGGRWPQTVPGQIHLMDADGWVLPPNEDLAAARDIASTVEGVELFLYAGDRHLFVDKSLADYDEDSARLVTQRALAFLDRMG